MNGWLTALTAVNLNAHSLGVNNQGFIYDISKDVDLSTNKEEARSIYDRLLEWVLRLEVARI
jgi:hypothetical protein